MTRSSAALIGRRGELMAELFLQDLGAPYVFRSSSEDFGIDFFVGFPNRGGGLNYVAVEVKSTEGPLARGYPVASRTLALLAQSNIPGLLLVVDVKQNRYYFNELTGAEAPAEKFTVMVRLTEATPEARKALTDKFSS